MTVDEDKEGTLPPLGKRIDEEGENQHSKNTKIAFGYHRVNTRTLKDIFNFLPNCCEDNCDLLCMVIKLITL